MTVTAILANIANAANPAAFHGTPETGWPRELKSTPRLRARQLPGRCRLFTYFFFLTAIYRARVDGSPITSFTLVTVDVSAFPLRRQRAGVYSDFVINMEPLMTVSMAYASARTRADRTHLFNGVVIAGSSADYHA